MVKTRRQTRSSRRANASVPAALPGPACRLSVDTRLASLPCPVRLPGSAEGTRGSCPSLATMVKTRRQTRSSPRANASVPAALPGPACRLSVDTRLACLPLPVRRPGSAEGTRGSCPSLATMVKTRRQTRSSRRANASFPVALTGPACRLSVDTRLACLPCPVRLPGSAEGTRGSCPSLATMVKTRRQTRSSRRANASVPVALPGPACRLSGDTRLACLPLPVRRPGSAEGTRGSCPSLATMVKTRRQTRSSRRANASVPEALPGPACRLSVDTRLACLPCPVRLPGSAERTRGSCPSLATMVKTRRQTRSSPRANASVPVALPGPACRLSVDTRLACLPLPVRRPGSAEGTRGSCPSLATMVKTRRQTRSSRRANTSVPAALPGPACRLSVDTRLACLPCPVRRPGSAEGTRGSCPSLATMVKTRRQTRSSRRANASVPAALPGPACRLSVDTRLACLPCPVRRPGSAEGTRGSCPSLATMVKTRRQTRSSRRANASVPAALPGPACRLSVDTRLACLPCPVRRPGSAEGTRGSCPSLATMVKTRRQTRSSRPANASVPAALPGPACRLSVDTRLACLPCPVRRPGSAEGTRGSCPSLATMVKTRRQTRSSRRANASVPAALPGPACRLSVDTRLACLPCPVRLPGSAKGTRGSCPSLATMVKTRRQTRSSPRAIASVPVALPGPACRLSVDTRLACLPLPVRRPEHGGNHGLHHGQSRRSR